MSIPHTVTLTPAQASYLACLVDQDIKEGTLNFQHGREILYRNDLRKLAGRLEARPVQAFPYP
tara:strand:+ start:475 stop:663 length:189 start_codon:yes stop_codon:yes gene_type:complete